VIVAVAALWLWVALPLALGEETLVFRDVFALHAPWKAFGAAEMAAGRIPAFNPTWGLGQPFRGNPQTLAFYPDNLLYLLLPFWSAFNLHYVLHWLLALVTMALLARETGASAAAALMAGVSWAGGGWGLTCLSFYNIVTVCAWWPLVLWAALRGGRTGIALGGLACGLALLGGEPLLAALGCAPLALAAVGRHGFRRGLLTAAALGGLGLLVALPQVVATLRILPFTFRGGAGVPGAQVSLYAFHPLRLLELAVPLPFGWPSTFGPLGWWAGPVLGRIPLIPTLYPGIVALALAVAGLTAGRRRGVSPAAWAALGGAGLLLAWVGGWAPGALSAASAGLFRFPEKFLFWPALALPLLAGFGLDRVLRRTGLWVRTTAVCGVAALALSALLFALSGRALELLGSWMADTRPAGSAAAQVALWLLALAAAGNLLILAAAAAHRRSGAALVALQVMALLQLFPLLPRDDTAVYRQPSRWTRELLERSPAPAVVGATLSSPFLTPQPGVDPEDLSVVRQLRNAALDLDPTPGVLFGLRYPLAPDADGLFSPLTTLMLYNLPFLDERARGNWLRVVGADALVAWRPDEVPGAAVLDVEEHAGLPTYLLAPASPAPAAWWPRAVVAAADPVEALKAVSRGEDPVARVAVPRPLEHDPEGRVRLLEAAADRLELEVESVGGGLAVVQRAYQPLLTAEAVEETPGAPPRRLETLPADLHLLGVVVPPGRHRVILSVSDTPVMIAAAAALLTAAGLAAVLLAPGLGRRRGRP
jgi:hypothetical protein